MTQLFMRLAHPLKRKLILSDLFFILFVIFAVIAVINPKWGTEYAPTEYRRGLDTIFAIDVSRSMDIPDASGSSSFTQTRLERGVLIAKESIISVSGARYGTAIGRGKGYLAVPLTYDNESALLFLESLDASSMTGRSTNLEALIDAAAGSFLDTSPAKKVIVLISDGEAIDGILRNAVNRCARDGIIITTVAMGSEEGRQIYVQAQNPDSQIVISRKETAVMRGIAERTGGIYIDGSRDDAGRELSSHLLSLVQDTERGAGKRIPKQRRPLFIILALIAYTASKFITRQSQRMQKAQLSQRAQLGAIVLTALLFSSCSEGKLLLLEANYLSSRGRFDDALVSYFKALNHEDAAPYAEYGIGLVDYLLDREEDALQRYADSRKLLDRMTGSEHRELRYRNHYNTGIIYFEEGDYDNAANSFKEALRIDPRRLEAKRNLELAIMSINMEAKPDNRTEERQEQKDILFEYLRSEEQQIWKSREWAPEEEFTGHDY
ncbi:MAG: VWA domain-containing protein [Treponema sp.]|nr:VWA domain-containing protein [Treponema sp.]